MSTRRITGKKSNVADPHLSRIGSNGVTRQTHLITSTLQRLNGRPGVIVDAATEPTETRHGMWALPCFL